MLVSIENIYKVFNGNELLKDINLTINDTDRIGLVGVNGCGKTTLLSILTGKIDFDKASDGSGSISISNGAVIGYLEQNTGLSGEKSIDEELRQPFAHLDSAYTRMTELERIIAETGDEKASEEYAELSTYFEANDGYLIDVKINTVLNGMGFAGIDRKRAIDSLSGGERTRLALAKLLLEAPSLLILDEPTNHLDLDTMMWLEDYLSEYKGAILTVSHNRYFLDRVCTRICEIEDGRLKSYTGNYTKFLELKKADNERQEKLFEAQQKKISELQFFIDKNRVSATSAKAAKSKQHMLDRIVEDAVEKPRVFTKPPKIKLEYDIDPPKDVLVVKEIDITAANKPLIDNFSLHIRRGEKVAIIGANGIGKSTILKTIQNLNPHSKGSVQWAMNVKIAYFDQKNEQLDPGNTVIDEIHRRYPRMTDFEIRSLLGKVLLTGENVYKQVGVISGGEKTKLSFALMMLKRANVLILDEPTNHLDIITKEVLEEALSEYTGTIIFVSHDRYLINKIATRTVEITKDGVKSYDGNFDSYTELKALEKADVNQAKAVKQDTGKKQYRTKQQRSEDARKKREMLELEAHIEELEATVAELETAICTPEVASDYIKMGELCQLLEESKAELSECMDKWAEG